MVIGNSFLAVYGYFEGGAIGNLLNLWAQQGVFTYIIPFLLIFALVYGILMRMNLFKDNKAINGIIALATALMALQFPTVPIFFSQLFPAMGVGLAVILAVLVLTGLFIDSKKNQGWMVFLAIGSMIVVAVVLLNSTWGLGYGNFGSWFNYYAPTAIPIIIVTYKVFLILRFSDAFLSFTICDPKKNSTGITISIII